MLDFIMTKLWFPFFIIMARYTLRRQHHNNLHQEYTLCHLRYPFFTTMIRYILRHRHHNEKTLIPDPAPIHELLYICTWSSPFPLPEIFFDSLPVWGRDRIGIAIARIMPIPSINRLEEVFSFIYFFFHNCLLFINIVYYIILFKVKYL